MPSYKKYLIAASLIFVFNGCSDEINNLSISETVTKTYKKVEHKNFDYEDQYIMYALEYENQTKIANARYLYLELFQKTNNYEYMIKYLKLSFQLKDYATIDSFISSTNDFRGIKEEEEILRLHVFALLRLKNTQKALPVAKNLINTKKRDINYELLGTIYLELKEFKKSYNAFDEAFKLNNSPTTILSLTNIQYYYLSQTVEAKKVLEDYISKNAYAFNTSFQLLSFYEKEKQSNKIIELLEKMYAEYKSTNKKGLEEKTKNLLVRYLAKKDINKAILFLEKNDPENIFLLTLYRNANSYEKLQVLLQKEYKRTKNVDFLAQLAIVEFELAVDKEAVLDSVISKFDKALNTLDNPIYQNYLGYILIDYDKDINRGITLVKKALKKEPDNLAYIDSLAWGEYKTNNCEEAHKLMKIVVDEAGLEDIEIKLHWEKIKECIK